MQTFTVDESCCFTGHRDIDRSLYNLFGDRVREEILRLYGMGVRRFIAGGALGFDMICAVVTHNLRNVYKDIFLTLALPCREHYISWKYNDIAQLQTLCRHADEVIYVSEEYDRGCMFRRNRYMVNNSRYCISYCVKKSGGSYYTAGYARSIGRTVIEISGDIDL